MKEYTFSEACGAYESIYKQVKDQVQEAKRLYEIKFKGWGFAFGWFFLVSFALASVMAIVDYASLAAFSIMLGGAILSLLALSMIKDRYQKNQRQLKMNFDRRDGLMKDLEKWQKKSEALVRGGPFLVEYFLVKGLDFELSESMQSREPLPEEIGRLQVELADEFNGIVKKVVYHT